MTETTRADRERAATLREGERSQWTESARKWVDGLRPFPNSVRLEMLAAEFAAVRAEAIEEAAKVMDDEARASDAVAKGAADADGRKHWAQIAAHERLAAMRIRALAKDGAK